MVFLKNGFKFLEYGSTGWNCAHILSFWRAREICAGNGYGTQKRQRAKHRLVKFMFILV